MGRSCRGSWRHHRQGAGGPRRPRAELRTGRQRRQRKKTRKPGEVSSVSRISSSRGEGGGSRNEKTPATTKGNRRLRADHSRPCGRRAGVYPLRCVKCNRSVSSERGAAGAAYPRNARTPVTSEGDRRSRADRSPPGGRLQEFIDARSRLQAIRFIRAERFVSNLAWPHPRRLRHLPRSLGKYRRSGRRFRCRGATPKILEPVRGRRGRSDALRRR